MTIADEASRMETKCSGIPVGFLFQSWKFLAQAVAALWRSHPARSERFPNGHSAGASNPF
ncbi:MAG: hypothetical protein JJT81_01835 [Rubellimicrobium sp.]|nr:hypothetical protein [Rubellimicrobium sp.]